MCRVLSRGKGTAVLVTSCLLSQKSQPTLEFIHQFSLHAATGTSPISETRHPPRKNIYADSKYTLLYLALSSSKQINSESAVVRAYQAQTISSGRDLLSSSALSRRIIYSNCRERSSWYSSAYLSDRAASHSASVTSNNSNCPETAAASPTNTASR